jgi:site-specific DNA-methyltransferase (adenine-specific)
MLVENQGHVPDILDCIANLSSDEVFTPPDVANQVLDLLPKEIWSNPDIKILDPCTKTGIFLRESARRLMIGLEKKIPDETERREHIFKNMLFGIAITELTGLVARRSLYYSKDAKNDYSIVQFKDSDGNIQFKRMEHDYVQGKCKVCGSPYENLERGEGMENYAYQFIHDREVSKMKFDVVVGNPPYQVQDGGAGASASPIYHLFVNQAFRLKPRYVSMIIPSRWFAGGKGLDSFREQMLESTHFRYLADFPAAADLFPSVEIKGGVCYFLWDEKYDGPCEVNTYVNGEPQSKASRFLGEHGDVFVRFNQALPILEKVTKSTEQFVDEIIQSRKPFGLPTNFISFSTKKSAKSVTLYTNNGIHSVEPNQITQNHQWIPKWKVLTSKGYNGGDNYPHQIIGKPIIAGPNTACTETYIICGIWESEKEAANFANYMRTKFFRFLVHLRKNTQDVTQSRFKFVPLLDMNIEWTDEKLFKKYGITEEEQGFISTLIREMGEDAE